MHGKKPLKKDVVKGDNGEDRSNAQGFEGSSAHMLACASMSAELPSENIANYTCSAPDVTICALNYIVRADPRPMFEGKAHIGQRFLDSVRNLFICFLAPRSLWASGQSVGLDAPARCIAMSASSTLDFHR